MKISKPLQTFEDYNTSNEIYEFFRINHKINLSKEEVEFYKSFYYLLNTGAQTSGMMTESFEFLNETDVESTFTSEIKDNLKKEKDSLLGMAKVTATVLAGLGIGAGGYLWWKIRTKKGKKMVDAENKVKIEIANAKVKAHKEIEAAKEKSRNLIDAATTPEKKEKLRDARDKKIEALEKNRDAELEARREYLNSLKSITDDYLSRKGVEEDKPEKKNESVVNEGFSGSEWVKSWIRSRRLKGDIKAKEIELEIASDKEKKDLEEVIRKKTEDIKAAEAEEQEIANAAEEEMSDEDRELEQQADEELSDEEEESDDNPDVKAGDVAKVKSLLAKKEFVIKTAKRAKEMNSEKLVKRAEELISKFSKEIEEVKDKANDATKAEIAKLEEND